MFWIHFKLAKCSCVAESFLVYWENEGSVTAVLSGCIDKPVVGERKIVKQGKNEYTGKLIYEGKQ